MTNRESRDRQEQGTRNKTYTVTVRKIILIQTETKLFSNLIWIYIPRKQYIIRKDLLI